MRYVQVTLPGFVVTHPDILLDEEPIQPGAVLIAVPDAVEVHEGQVYDSLRNEFTAGPQTRRLTQFEFMSRLGFPAVTNILAAARTDVEIDSAWKFAEMADFVDLDLPLTATLLGLLAVKGIISAGEVAVILGGGAL